MRIDAPWTDEQVRCLNRFQQYAFVHPFTCVNAHEGDRVLVATREGWRCPSCSYTQTWAHEVMLQEFFDPLQPLL